MGSQLGRWFHYARKVPHAEDGFHSAGRWVSLRRRCGFTTREDGFLNAEDGFQYAESGYARRRLLCPQKVRGRGDIMLVEVLCPKTLSSFYYAGRLLRSPEILARRRTGRRNIMLVKVLCPKTLAYRPPRLLPKDNPGAQHPDYNTAAPIPQHQGGCVGMLRSQPAANVHSYKIVQHIKRLFLN
eukprot:Seg3531.3 transcript_id=Seg3531.3/GoldUCD/mRNA.D3Y31 product="hypothetical protein" pseudo=true protein_id=Seg3531.3/GoldUCD/D3Y31